ncbi:hypothetical protein MASS_1266 [Mycobacteroides abscessus subsp. bolletii 50594]|uniref:Uncharacterized protein n=1 Tax=Mycobacteroides abscessus subsp. bolletii 50594 TaxID=1303024 RepID=A0AB33A7V4_9MYCO|nr:hypothetical protein MASS_1266 [Mycobacteroides abscessus subsp. bolletii 50594]
MLGSRSRSGEQVGSGDAKDIVGAVLARRRTQESKILRAPSDFRMFS